MSLKLQILMALLSCAAVRAQCDDDGLVTGQSKCTSCLTFATCGEQGMGADMDCDPGTTCFQDGDTNAVCVSPTLHECVTCPAGALTTCDPFDPYQVVACVPGKAPVPIEDCSDAGNEVCQNGECVDGTTPDPGSGGNPGDQCSETTGSVIITSKPECTSGLVCSEGGLEYIFNCTEGEYFDPNSYSCQSLPVNNCEGVDDGEKGPYRTDCSKYVVCDGGEQVNEYDCDPGEVFDSTGVCLLAADATCVADLDGCTFENNGSGGSSETTSGSDETTTAESGGSETTTSSSTTKPEECTADNVNQRYPVEGDCKSYWVCRKTSSDTYAYIEAQCSGELVYNPESTYCDLPENVPGCEE